jgi:hypothetical protein
MPNGSVEASPQPAHPDAAAPWRRVSAAALAGVALWSASACAIIVACARGVIGYDGSYNASIAKNVALGFGYRSSYHEWVAFNPDVTTGPVVLLPLAAWIRLFGNGLVTPTVWMILVNLAGMALTMILVRRAQGPAASLVAMCAFLLIQRCFGFAIWYEPRGELAGALLSIVGTLLLFRESRAAIVIGALCLGLAPGAKLTCAMATPVALACFFFSRRRADGERIWPAVLAAAIAPSLAWLGYAAATLRSGFWATARDWMALVSLESGVAEPRPDGLGAQLWGRMSALSALFGGPWRALPLFALLVAATLGLLRARPSHDARPTAPARALLAMAAVQLIWWSIFEQSGVARHVVIAMLLLVPVVAMGTLALDALPRRIALAGGAAIVVSLWLAPPPLPSSDRSRANVYEAVRFLSSLERDPQTLLLGCGWWANRTLEYALPGPLHFRDASRLRPDDVAGRALYLVRSKEFWNWSRSAPLEQWAQECERATLFENREFQVSRCRRLPGDARDPE